MVPHGLSRSPLKPVVIAAIIFVTACTANVGLRRSWTTPSDTVAQCAEQCGELGLPVQSIMLEVNRVGCICLGPDPSVRSASPPSCTVLAPALVAPAAAAPGGAP
jgi:hypothetical protein